MLELSHPGARTQARAGTHRNRWGIVDVILAVLMLPFAIAMFVIEGMVNAVVHGFQTH